MLMESDAPRVCGLVKGYATVRMGGNIWGGLALLALAALVGCADDSDRRFANDPIPAEDVAGATPAAAVEQEPTPTQSASRPQASPQTLLVARGAPDRLFFLQGNQVWSVSSDGSRARLILDPGSARVVALASSPAANEVAVLLREDDGPDGGALVILDADGRELRRWDGLEAPADDATGSAVISGLDEPTLDWSPQGDQLLAVTGGRLWAIPLPDGEPAPLALDERLTPAAAAWSPAGGAVAFIASNRSDTPDGALYVASTGAPSLDPVAVAPRQPGSADSVADLAWRPDGSGILFTASGAPAGAGTGRDLFSISAGGEDLTLVASAGRLAPAARVVGVAPSPDGRAVAYTIWAPGGQDLAFHSLWVQPLAGGPGYQVPVPAGQTVTDAWWTNRGLVWRTVEGSSTEESADTGSPFALHRVDRSGQPVKIYEADPGSPASPVASPAVSPLASPRSEEATPEPEVSSQAQGLRSMKGRPE